jgi:hypothetical protein
VTTTAASVITQMIQAKQYFAEQQIVKLRVARGAKRQS